VNTDWTTIHEYNATRKKNRHMVGLRDKENSWKECLTIGNKKEPWIVG
jgi:hypothetical protein